MYVCIYIYIYIYLLTFMQHSNARQHWMTCVSLAVELDLTHLVAQRDGNPSCGQTNAMMTCGSCVHGPLLSTIIASSLRESYLTSKAHSAHLLTAGDLSNR